MLGLVVEYLLRYRWRFVVGALFTLLGTLFGLLTPWLLRQAIDTFSGRPQPGWPLYVYAAAIVAVALLESGSRFASRLVSTGASRWVEYDLRNRFFAHLETLEPAFFQDRRTGDLVARSTNDLSAVRQLYGPALSNVLNTVLVFSLSLTLIVQISPALAIWCALILPSSVALFIVTRTRLEQRFTQVQEQFAALSDQAQETFSGERVVKAYAQEQPVVQAFRAASEEYVRRQLAQTRVTGLLWPSMTLSVGLATVVLLYVGGREVVAQRITLGELVQVYAYMGMLAWPMMALGWVATLWQQGSASLRRIHEVLSRPPTIADPPAAPEAPAAVRAAVDGRAAGNSRAPDDNRAPDDGRVPVDGRALSDGHAAVDDRALAGGGPNGWVPWRRAGGMAATDPGVRGSIELCDVSLVLDGREVLREVSLTIPAGATVAIVGPLGAGKSSLVSLIPRLRDPTAGQVLVDGVDVREWPLAALRRQVGFVPQETFLFSGPLRDSVAFGLAADEATTTRIQAAVRLSRLENDLDQWPHGLETTIGERGVTLSGGQKQRAAIARAVARDPTILVLDDALSSVDTRTEEAILAGLREFMARRTSVVIAHRVSTVRMADCILVLDRGRLVEQGTHAELVRRGGVYARLYRRQLIAQELGVEDEEGEGS